MFPPENAISRDDGGGGNRTRVSGTTETVAVQEFHGGDVGDVVDRTAVPNRTGVGVVTNPANVRGGS